MPRPPPYVPSKEREAPRPQEDYWEKFLRMQNLVGSISESLEENAMQQQYQTQQQSRGPVTLHPDMLEWAHRVAEALVPLDRTVTDPEDRRRQIQKRQEIRNELTDVLSGKTNFNEWFDKTKTRFSIRLPEYVQIFYESLEGLKSNEAKILRQQYSEWLENVNRQYTPR